jgi:hypothetical protein
MSGRHVFQYTFAPQSRADEIESALVLAIMGIQSLHGETAARLSARHYFDKRRRELVIDDSSQIGHDLNRLFVGFIARDVDTNQFSVRRIEGPMPPANVETNV